MGRRASQLLVPTLLVATGFLFTLPARAQSNQAQRYQITKVSFQYSSNNLSKTRCLRYYPLQGQQQPSIQFDDLGKAFIRLNILAKIEDKCAFTIGDPSVFKETLRSKGLVQFEVTVHPPLTTVTVSGPDFKDQLAFEAPIKDFEGIGFFNFFKRSKVYFETRYATLSTDNPDVTGPTQSATVYPVFGGSIGVPFPWIDNVVVSYSMFQNLGNLRKNVADKASVQISEFAFEGKYDWVGREERGRPELAAVVGFRGRNIYQLTDVRPFVIGSIAMPTVGFEAGWFPFATVVPFSKFASRIGFDISLRYSFGDVKSMSATNQIESRKLSSLIADTSLNYRFSRKWAVGLGYSYTRQQAAFPDLDQGRIVERIQSVFLRLSLIPYHKDTAEAFVMGSRLSAAERGETP